MADQQHIHRAASLSSDGLHRYTLERSWENPDARPSPLVFLMCNPSTADSTVDDATITRCMSFTHAFERRRLVVVNLFTLRSTEPKALRGKNITELVGIGQRDALGACLTGQSPVVCAWGASVDFVAPSLVVKALDEVREALYGFEEHLRCLGTTARGHPKHPLYLPANTQLQPFNLDAYYKAMETR